MAVDEECMRRALALARRAWGKTHPNPMVGAVIVESGTIVAEGWHTRAGEAHAEVAALAALGRPPSPGATLYVTLEPCSTHGRTPPCTKAIQAASISRVVVGALDPNPAHAGRGLQILRAAGVEVTAGVLADACEDLNLVFNHWITTGRPLIAGKVALTLDGRTATRAGHSQWITGEAARADVHRWRALFPAIAVGAGTVLQDDPALTARLPEGTHCPRRFVFDRRLAIADAAARGFPPRLLTDAYARQTVIVAGETARQQGAERLAHLRGRYGIDTWILPEKDDTSFFHAFALRCAGEGISGVLVESGGRLISGLLHAGCLDYLLAYRAPIVLADAEAPGVFGGASPARIDDGWRLRDVHHATFEDDQLIRGWVQRP